MTFFLAALSKREKAVLKVLAVGFFLKSATAFLKTFLTLRFIFVFLLSLLKAFLAELVIGTV